MPLEWKELKHSLKPTDFNIGNSLLRIKKKGDLFLPTLGEGIDMLKALEKSESLKIFVIFSNISIFTISGNFFDKTLTMENQNYQNHIKFYAPHHFV